MKQRTGTAASSAVYRLRFLGQGRTARNLAGFVLFLGLATAFSSDQAPKGIIAKASALSIGDSHSHLDKFDPFARPAQGLEASQATAMDIARDLTSPAAAASQNGNAIEVAFAAVEFGTRDMPALRSTLDDSFAMVAVASRGQNVNLRSAVAALDSDDDAQILPKAFPGAFPRSKPMLPASAARNGVEVASLAPDTGAETILRNKKTLDLGETAGLPRIYPKGSEPYLDIIKREARANGVPLWIALGVIWVESKYNPKLRGSHTVMGMMQVMPSTARELGYRGSAEQLLDAETNVVWGMKELGKDYKMANGDLCMTIAKYTGGFMTTRVRPAAQRYCNEVRRVTGMNGAAQAAL
jgi:soluble lytic murein transglycosylase-like protein